MSTKDSCKFHDIKNNNNQPIQHNRKQKILIQKNYTKVFGFPCEKLSKWTENLWCWIFVGLVVVVHFDWVKSHLGNLDFECLLLLYVNNFFLYIFLKLLFIYFFVLLSSLSVVVSLVLQNNRNSFLFVCLLFIWLD